MATITSKRFTVLQQVDKTHKARYYGSQQSAFNWLVVNGYVQTDYHTAHLTEKGQNELSPMVDQSQPVCPQCGKPYVGSRPSDGSRRAGP